MLSKKPRFPERNVFWALIHQALSERVYVSSTRMKIFNHIFLLLTILVVFSAVVAEARITRGHVCRPLSEEDIRKWLKSRQDKLKLRTGH
ncbi:unnamed protein product [Cylicocyclus nassatus]|uniref:Uncharacterized protein n=1 Tax=Cylicocyclus nassatus TaxID=53992 RepID=A0AA36HA48_CYLNA|nr:unnamed protein product [Cylicocyclus nassatus]